VTGRVLDESNAGLNGVTVQEMGTSNSVSTNADGTFRITVSNGSATLQFTYIGYFTQEVPLNNRSNVNVSMKPDPKSLEGVVVVGYGTQKKSDVTGALVSVSEETIRERPVSNVLQALQGKAAGINVSTNMKPGELPVVRVRGNRSINASNDPLYVVDGIPIVNALGVSSFSINDINPNDIASIEILKDASATAIYGSRGANGVVLISTKKGTKGKISVNYNTTVSLDYYKSLTDWMDGGQWIDRWRESLINGRSYQPTTNTDLKVPATSWYPDPFLDRSRLGLEADPRALESVWMGYEWEEYGVTPKMRPTTAEERAMGWPDMVPVYNSGNIRNYDWIDAATRTGLTQNHQVSLSTGTQTARLYLSLSYLNQKGVQRDQDFERFNVNINGDISATKFLTLGISMIGSLSEQDFGISANSGNTGSKDLYSRAIDQFPYALPKDENGLWVRNPGGFLNLWNPLIDIDQSINNRRTASVLANTFAEISFTPWLKYRVNFGAQMRNFRNGTWTGPDVTGHLNQIPSTAGFSRDEHFSWVVENLLFFNKTIGTDHDINVTLLQSSQKSRRENIGLSARGVINPISYWYDLGSNTNGNPSGYGTGFTENKLSSFMARINYAFKNKYLLTASYRADGSSVLAPDHKWDYFPSFSVAWKMQEEGFLQGVPWITELKPRFGFGITGNSSVDPYTTSGPLSRNPYVFGSTAGIGYLPQLVQNPQLGWEKTAQWNAGIDFSFIKGRLTGSIEVYDAQTSDLLNYRSLSPVSGYVQKLENIGKTRNQGYEITLSAIPVSKSDFTWSVDVNFARNKERVVELLNANPAFIGQPLSVFYHYDNDGIWQNTKEDLDEMAKFNANGHRFYPGLIRVVDQNGDYRINGEDYIVRGSGVPKWTGGITNTFRYRNFSLSSFIYARVGQTYFGGYPNSYGGQFPNGRVENDVWGWNNAGGRWPIPIMGVTVDNFTPAMQFNSGTFYVVRNISVLYDVPANFLNRFHINGMQVNVQVLNPFIFGGDIVQMGINPDDVTNWSSVSQPNSNNSAPLGGTNNNTILPQSIVFGLRVGF
ncbi:MAG: TonB-dependent receptor, partial [Pseudomonadota bacterium]|nr:TonB-dependent receptor [Pseudomonadota bacterium]